MTYLETSKMPKYKKIKKSLKDMIVAGELKPGEKLPTIKILAKQYKVSEISVKGAFRELINEGLISTMRGSGSYVSKLHKGGGNGRQVANIAVYTDIMSMGNQVQERFMPMLNGMSQMASTYKFRFEIIHPPKNVKCFAKDNNLNELLESGQISGLIVYPSNEITWDDFHFLERSGVPFVIADYCKDPLGRGLRAWVEDNWFEKMLTTMLNRRYKKIALIFGWLNDETDFFLRSAQFMLSSYNKIMAEANVSIRPEYLVKGGWTSESGYVLGKKLLSLPDPPKVICAADDCSAVGVIKAAFEMGFNVPTDLVVWGRCDWLKPSILSTVREDLEGRGKHAVSALVQLMEGGVPSKERDYCQLVFRASTGDSDNAGEARIRSWVEEYFNQDPMDENMIRKFEQDYEEIEIENNQLLE
jgi:DNA-binding LacI/PurR family transcriptional regulator